MGKKRVMFVVPQLGPGGSERVVIDLARTLDPVCHAVYAAAFKGGALEISLKPMCINKREGFDGSLMLKLAKIVRLRVE